VSAEAVRRCLATWAEWRYPDTPPTVVTATAESLAAGHITDTELDDLMEMWHLRNRDRWPTAAELCALRDGRLEDEPAPMDAPTALATARASLEAARARQDARNADLRRASTARATDPRRTA